MCALQHMYILQYIYACLYTFVCVHACTVSSCIWLKFGSLHISCSYFTLLVIYTCGYHYYSYYYPLLAMMMVASCFRFAFLPMVKQDQAKPIP